MINQEPQTKKTQIKIEWKLNWSEDKKNITLNEKKIIFDFSTTVETYSINKLTAFCTKKQNKNIAY